MYLNDDMIKLKQSYFGGFRFKFWLVNLLA